MAKASTEGKALPLTLVPPASFTAFSGAARNGFVAVDGGKKLSASEYMESLVAAPESVGAGEMVGAYFAGNAIAVVGQAALMMVPGVNIVMGAAFLGNVLTRGTAPLALAGKIGVTIVVANGLEGALIQTDYVIAHGNQTGYPAVVDPADLQPPQKAGVVDGHSILQGMDEPLELYGIGCYRFEKDRTAGGLGVFGTSGALAFISDDPATNGKTMAIAWHLPELVEPGHAACAVTADLTGSYKSLLAFYEATAGASSTKFRQAETADWTIHSSLVLRTSSAESKMPGGEFVLTVAVEKGRA